MPYHNHNIKKNRMGGIGLSCSPNEKQGVQKDITK